MMPKSSQFNQTKEIVLNLIEKGDPFTKKELEKAIKERKSCMRVGPNYTVEEYMENLEEYGAIVYDKKSRRYVPHQKEAQ